VVSYEKVIPVLHNVLRSSIRRAEQLRGELDVAVARIDAAELRIDALTAALATAMDRNPPVAHS